jgi:hypothetical protein
MSIGLLEKAQSLVAVRPYKPNQIDWGTIILMKNESRIVTIWSFKCPKEKSKILVEANRKVLTRKDRYNKYDVVVKYGITAYEHISKTSQESAKGQCASSN